MAKEELEVMAQELVKHRTLEEKREYLLEQGRVQHIPEDSKLSWALSIAYPERFCNIGSYFYYRKPQDSDKKFFNICIVNGRYLYEKYPIIFEFYDEYVNGISYEEEQENQKTR